MKQIIKKGIVLAGLAGILLGCSSADQSYKLVARNSTKTSDDKIALGVGDGARCGYSRFIYSGMPSEKTFTIIAEMSAATADRGTLYFPADAKEVHIDDKIYTVLKVTPDSLVLGDEATRIVQYLSR